MTAAAFPDLAGEIQGNRFLVLTLPVNRVYEVGAVLKKGNGFIKATLDAPGKPRSTGEHSQNNCWHGWCAFIAKETGNSKSVVERFLKLEACNLGLWPFEAFQGVVEPESTADATVEQMKCLLEVVQSWAADWGMKLPEVTK